MSVFFRINKTKYIFISDPPLELFSSHSFYRHRHLISPDFDVGWAARGSKTCHYCGKHISSASNLHKHIFRMHRVQPILQCSVCKAPVKDKYSLRDHVRTQHGVRSAKKKKDQDPSS